MKVVVLVPRRADHGLRDATWNWVREWWASQHPEWPIVEGGHDGPGLFSRAVAVNRAAAAAGSWDVAVILDADTICDAERTRRAVELAADTGRMVMPFTVRLDLSQAGSRRVMAGFRGNWRPFVIHQYPEMCSAVVCVSHALWDAVEGFDEAFAGWGWEDNAFACACRTFSGADIEKLPGEAWHLWHARNMEKPPANRTRADRYLAAVGDRDAIRAIRESPMDTASPGTLSVPDLPPSPGIPRILHRVVPVQTSAKAEAWWAEFGRLHPGWELMTHRDPLEPADWHETSKAWRYCETGASLADLVRLEALWRWGGIYVDSDVQPFRSFEPLLPLLAFASWEDAKVANATVIGARAEHPAIRACLDLALREVRKPGTWQAGPGVISAVLPGRSDVLLLPPDVFGPVDYRDPRRAQKMRDFDPSTHPWTFALHHFDGSWLTKRKAGRVA
jgi:Glycosyltransferase sugar-binding region containing DXD motif/N-terminal domain of galactosyltransferase